MVGSRGKECCGIKTDLSPGGNLDPRNGPPSPLRRLVSLFWRGNGMGRYRKKPVEVEAFQMTRERRIDNSEWPEWMHKAWNEERESVGSLYPTEEGNQLSSSSSLLDL